MPDQNTAPSPSSATPVAESWQLRRHAEKQDVSWSDAWRYFRSVGYDMSNLDPFEDTDEVRSQADDILKERGAAPYDANNRPPLPANSVFADFDPLDRAESTPEQAEALEHFGVVAEQEPSTTPDLDPYAAASETVLMPDAAAAGPIKVRKRPVSVEAIQFTGGAQQASVVIDWVLSHGGTARYHEEVHPKGIDPMAGIDDEYSPEYIEIQTLEGVMQARALWWVIRGIKGEFYPCDAEIFAGSYEDDTDDGMEEVRVPRDTLVFAVPNDLTVAELFRQFGGNLPS